MYGPREKVFWFAVTSRLVVISLQFIFNRILPDHDAHIFNSPLDPEMKTSIYDSTVEYLFGGFLRWDAQYFIHIAKYGYTYEKTLAFYPLYPMSIRCLSVVLRVVFFSLNDHSIAILAALLINFICFVKSATVFYDLSKIVLKDTALAYKAAILYCINPASIFFSAFYSEAMFAWLSFNIMLAYVNNNPYIYLPIGLSILVRSNGLINLGYPVYSYVRCLIRTVLPKVSRNYQNSQAEPIFPFGCHTMLGSFLWLLNVVFLSIVPYILHQLYNYSLYCTYHEVTIPDYVLNHSDEDVLLIPGTVIPPWCKNSIPVAYSYIQAKYWNVGFMQYWMFQHLPNILLGFPSLYLILCQSFKYLSEHRIQLYTLGSFSTDVRNCKKSKNKKLSPDIFVFVVHGICLVLICLGFVHLEVSTRLLCSASPLLYWCCASKLSYKSERRNENAMNAMDFEYPENLNSKWRVFFLSQTTHSKNDIIILSYYLAYTGIGCGMFSNNLPWT
ncbi:GPI mannosyltransferase 2 [Neodiprion pinetum]|uniref:GPI mannosyltransferase 2 n=1 Tax=Neodiprion pinetum TaxID=441929 RepID=UPI001EDFC26F|nr:GPI mannosyltransferase 2 [Neodiprion pinetum]XP_046484974.1 GPI mannosyltransferase 2 [Neodiprion pinetum]XP_046484975.1 GPI mannosyltransferase 2 [Neodiprion pinetum]XP_046484976.1 GPI mannosyltransferase 2 [Neodiprion pinetum]XP_046484977.1 GPI mannosyltransferase 2 [Neodiprion pinetum]XP_046484978.1 GPI mannosyltransferase 2 [Neodiprion pinetum]XP_046484979.1 GPI mannosyltransferase 2 [Neodiprion pinetum]XP_046484980.1 GPI mannosyltransferase 2 [Neodiprion pinetum]